MKFDAGRLELLYSCQKSHPFPFAYLVEIAILFETFGIRPFTMIEYEEAVAAAQEQVGITALQLATDYLKQAKEADSKATSNQLFLVASDFAELFHCVYEFGLDIEDRISFYKPNLVSFNVLSQVGGQLALTNEDVYATMLKVFV